MRLVMKRNCQYYMNKSKDLKDLFKSHLENKKNSGSNVSSYRNGYSYPSAFINKGASIEIYFYEWSDVYRTPRYFGSLYYFNMFLKNSGIDLTDGGRSIIETLGKVYITCRKGEKRLIFRSSYDALVREMKE